MKAFVETTVLTDFLLKLDGSEIRARDVLQNYEFITVPHFAWKEFKRGPLTTFIWAHNKLAETKSFNVTLQRVQGMSRTPKRYFTSTAIQAIQTAFSANFADLATADVFARYGSTNFDEMMADACRLELRRVISRSWSSRFRLFDGITDTLSCYPDAELFYDDGMIVYKPYDCPKGTDCCLKDKLSLKSNSLKKIRLALGKLSDKSEIIKRREVVKRIEKHPSSVMSPSDCRSFGDAYFVLFCPDGHDIITTNLSDIKPMADELNINVVKP